MLSLLFMVACGNKETKEEPKGEAKHEAGDAKKDKGKPADSKGGAGHGDAKKDEEPEVKSPAIVAHLRIELNREAGEENVPSVTPKVEEAPKVVEKGEEAKEVAQIAPPPSAAPQDMRYKTDKEYLALRRFDLPVPKEEKKAKESGDKGEAETIGVSEKILVMGGRGSDIQSFRSKAKLSMEVDSTRHLEEPLPKEPPRKEPPRLDLKEENIRSKRSLIFNQQGTGFFKVEEPEKKYVTPKAVAPPKTSPALEKVPETQLLISQGKDSQMILRPKEELDLLLGNEDFNRRAFYSEHKSSK